MRSTARIRDPIHGTQKVTKAELRIIDHRAIQRLRGVKQLGLADLAYPGATHTRYAHALGVMHLAGRVFDTVTQDHEIELEERHRLRTTLRLAALMHDVGHAPLSHSTEQLLPSVDRLELGEWRGQAPLQGSARKASHEDYTLAIILQSSLTEALETMKDAGVLPTDVAALLTESPPASCPNRFILQGRDWRPFLRQCVSSELDVDRMDYLLRDSYFAGVPYGRFDLEWLLENLKVVERPPQSPGAPNPMHLGIAARASFGFEDFLLSRFHMFLAVYLHHVPVGYELTLKGLQDDETFELPSDVERFVELDDLEFYARLRRSQNPWARRIVERRAYRLLLEHQKHDERDEGPNASMQAATEALHEAKIPVSRHVVRGRLSKYFNSVDAELPNEETLHLPGMAPQREEKSPTIYVVGEGAEVPLEKHVALYRRYRDEVSLDRIYVAPENADRAKAALSALSSNFRR